MQAREKVICPYEIARSNVISHVPAIMSIWLNRNVGYVELGQILVGIE